MSLEELDGEERGSGKWTTSFRLAGKAKGAVLNVSFGFEVVGSTGEEEDEKRVVARSGSMAVGRRDRARSVEDVRELHEVLPCSRSEASVLEDDDAGVKLAAFAKLGDSKEEDLKAGKGNGEEKESEESEFTVMEQGVEATEKDRIKEPDLEKIEFRVEGGVDFAVEQVGESELEKIEFETEKGVGVLAKDQVCEYINEETGTGHGHEEVSVKKLDLQLEEVMFDSRYDRETEEDVDSAFDSQLIVEWEKKMESQNVEPKTPDEMSYAEMKSNYKAGATKSKSVSLDDETVASEFLSMLGIEHSPFGLSSDSDTESPRGQLWKQFKKESISTDHSIFNIGMGAEQEPDWADGDLADDFDLSAIVQEAEMELQKACQATDSMSRAKMMEDAETEALMREWGLNEKAFHHSPPGSRSGFGSPIDIPPEEPLELPPLCEGLGPFVQTKDGGFLRSMSPALFKNAKNDGNLIMQVSSPVVVPAEMGSGIMDILQRLASVGIEKLSMQAKKLMPLGDVTGITMQQLAWEAAPAVESCERFKNPLV